MAAPGKLINLLRGRVGDLGAVVPAFTLSVTGKCQTAHLELVRGVLIVDVTGGDGVASLRLDLNHPTQRTLSRLVDTLQRVRGYAVDPDSSMASDYSSVDLEVSGIHDIANGKAYTFKHRAFSDKEILELLDQAVSMHNPMHTVGTLPSEEESLVLLAAEGIALRHLAAGAAKKRGLAVDAEVLLSLARASNEVYEQTASRLARIVAPPKANEDKMGTGDAVQGHLHRRSLRAGYWAQARNANPPTNPILYPPDEGEVEDTQVRLRWSQARDESFSLYELWRNHTPDVERNMNGRLLSHQHVAGNPAQSQHSRSGTSKQVFGVSYGHLKSSPVFEGFYFHTAAERQGLNVSNTVFIDGMVVVRGPTTDVALLGEPLEPESDYYYRLYLINWNGEVIPSEVVRVTTRKMRARFSRLASGAIDLATAMSPLTGPLAGGTSVTIRGTRFVAGMKVLFGSKEATITAQTSTELTVTVPEYYNTEFVGRRLDVVLVSPTGLQDIYARAWEVSA